MNIIEAALRRAVDDLTRHGQRWALIGGFAVSARTEPRFTHDVDIAVAVEDDVEAESLARSLLGDGYRLLASIEQEATGRLATVRLSSPASTDAAVVVDVLFASSGIEPEIVRAADLIEIVHGLRVPVARTGHLIALKLLARDDNARPQDLSDLRALCSVATASDLAEAQEAVTLISQRGFARGRDLVAVLDELPDLR
jgi:predicted nucleotidyltransferase